MVRLLPELYFVAMGGTQKQWERRAKLAEKRGALLDKRIEATWKLVETARKIVIEDSAYCKAVGRRIDAAIRRQRKRPWP